jgi:chromate transport protein ChrA
MFYGIAAAVTAILGVAVWHRTTKDKKRARSSLDAFCIMLLLAFFTVLLVCPIMSFRNEGGH